MFVAAQKKLIDDQFVMQNVMTFKLVGYKVGKTSVNGLGSLASSINVFFMATRLVQESVWSTAVERTGS